MKIKFLTLLAAFPLLSGCVIFNQNKNNVPVEYVECEKHRVNIEYGTSEVLKATVFPEKATNKKYTWSSENTSIATIENSGKVSAVGKGLTNVTVKTEDGGKTDSVAVYCYDNTMVQGIELSASAVKMEIGDTKTLVSTITPSSALNKTISWTSSDENVATINNGIISAIGSGFANITAVTEEGNFTAVCAVKVEEETEMWDSSQDSLRTGSKQLSFYSFNDFHGSTAASDNGEEPGINYLSSYIKSLKNENPDGFVLTSSGDMWQGSADSNITRGRLVVDWMNKMEFSAMAVGNHEFDWTIKQIETNQMYSSFDMVACNIMKTDTLLSANPTPVDWVKPYTTITRNGVHIGIIGAIGEGITSSILSSNVKGLTFVDPNPYIVSWADMLREEGADVVMVLLHDAVNNITSSTAAHVDGIFGGHTHKGENYTINDTPAIQAVCNGKAIGKIKLFYDFSNYSVTEYTKSYEKLSVKIIKNKGLGEDAEVKAMYQNYLDNEISEIKNEVVSSYTGGIAKNNIPYVYNDYAYKYFEEVHKAEDNYDIKFVWTNQARSDIPASSKGITYGDIYKALPFDNYLCLCSATGSQIKSMLSYGDYSNPDGTKTDFDSIKGSVTSSKTYYFLVINFVAERKDYVGKFEFVKNYMEEDAMPRNILKRYLNGYPSNSKY